jgi:hypothetical protein
MKTTQTGITWCPKSQAWRASAYSNGKQIIKNFPAKKLGFLPAYTSAVKARHELVEKYKANTQIKHGASNDRRYTIAANILARCSNPKCEKYLDYGGRGIQCLLGQTTAEVYLALLKVPGYDASLTIDRIDVNGHYELNNLRWATKHEQAANTRNSNQLVGVGYNKARKYWHANLKVQGKSYTKAFSVNKYGYDEAKQLAIDYNAEIRAKYI